jgi:hypothetical protein
MIGGLPAGSSVSPGSAYGTSSWMLPAAGLDRAFIIPPPGFAGDMNLTIELRLADNMVADRKSVRLSWLADAPPAAPQPPAAQPSAAQPPAARRLDPEEVDILLKRGSELVAKGDLVGARLIYRRAAEAGDPTAALALAETYDPSVLDRRGEHGLAPDVALARAWYEKAMELGASAATRRLEILAGRDK